ncbi:MAG: lysophospholipid acyltransferase family protein [Gemmatimonadota bacterium]
MRTPPPLSRGSRAGLGARGVHLLARAVARSLCRLDVRGRQHVPTRGACLLIFNHVSNFDLPLIFAALPRTDVVALVAADRRDHPLSRFVDAAGGLWLRRGGRDRATLERAVGALARGCMVGLAPEGGRSPTGGLRRAHTGLAFLVERSGAPILPVAVTGAEQLHRSWRALWRPQVRITFGAPLSFDASPSGLSGKAFRRRETDRCMVAVAGLLPERYRGFYGEDAAGALARDRAS